MEFCPRESNLVADNEGNVTVQGEDLETGFAIDDDDDWSDKDAYTGGNSVHDVRHAGNRNGIFTIKSPLDR